MVPRMGEQPAKRLREEHLVFGAIEIVIRVSAEDSGGAMTVLEEVPPMSDTPLHVHSREDELFYIVEGEHVITLGNEEHRLGPGDAIFAPRNIPHAQRRVEPGVGRELIVLTPGGFEQFFRDLAEAERNGTLGPDAYAAASERAGITWL
ncbi:MAG TPA: cupin domain-containing protein, partial [Solirubrobacterales bacterium]|nr:cupin domain-containing protein [Solirubrobacterales bacterium]